MNDVTQKNHSPPPPSPGRKSLKSHSFMQLTSPLAKKSLKSNITHWNENFQKYPLNFRFFSWGLRPQTPMRFFSQKYALNLRFFPGGFAPRPPVMMDFYFKSTIRDFFQKYSLNFRKSRKRWGSGGEAPRKILPILTSYQEKNRGFLICPFPKFRILGLKKSHSKVTQSPDFSSPPLKVQDFGSGE